MNAASVQVLTIIGGGDTQTLLAVKKIIELYALSCGGDVKTSDASTHYEPPGETHYLKFS